MIYVFRPVRFYCPVTLSTYFFFRCRWTILFLHIFLHLPLYISCGKLFISLIFSIFFSSVNFSIYSFLTLYLPLTDAFCGTFCHNFHCISLQNIHFTFLLYFLLYSQGIRPCTLSQIRKRHCLFNSIFLAQDKVVILYHIYYQS